MKKTALIVFIIFLGTHAYSQSATYKMSKIFKGNYTESEIKKKLDTCIRLYGYTPNEENYNKFGSVLYTLTESNNFSHQEMELLDCIIMTKQKSPKVQLKFTDTAALCATLMSPKKK